MSSRIERIILEGVFGVVSSIARIFLRYNLGYREFSDLAKTAFVQAATEDYGIRGRPTNISRVAVMTGLTRKEVKRIRDLGSGFGDAFISRRNPLAELLHYWNTYPDYLDSSGKPLALAFEGSDISFWSLVRQCAGDIPPGAMRTELKRIGAVKETENGLLEVTTREHFPQDADGRLMIGINHGLRQLAATVAFNSDPEQEITRTQKFVDSPLVSKRIVPALQAELDARLSEFAVTIDDRFSEIERESRIDGEGDKVSVGVGLYFYSDE